FENGKMSADFVDIQRLFAGEIDAHNAIIHNLTLTGFMKKRAFHVTADNFHEVTKPIQYKGRASYQVDFTKTGSFVVFDFLPQNNVYLVFPSVTRNYGSGMTKERFQNIIPVMEMLGANAVIVNNTRTLNMFISGCFIGAGMSLDTFDSNSDQHDNDVSYYYKDRYLLPSTVISLECKWNTDGIGANGPGDMYIYWLLTLLLPTGL
ncbi:MAG: hypothetical protein SO013_06000, partial [Prevotella sp.]|nr:hypothetical protein [Prevotella sp.]